MSGVDRETCDERMRQVAALVKLGWNSKKIARHTGLSLATVYRYQRRIRLGSVPVGSGKKPRGVPVRSSRQSRREGGDA